MIYMHVYQVMGSWILKRYTLIIYGLKTKASRSNAEKTNRVHMYDSFGCLFVTSRRTYARRWKNVTAMIKTNN